MDQRLVIVRHAKASHGDHGSDHARPLTDRGRRDARHLAERLTSAGIIPDRVLCSDAARTVETWMTMAARMPSGVELLVTPKLYGGGPAELGALLSEQPAHLRTLLAVGHNPGLEEIVSSLAGSLTPMGTANAALFLREAPVDAWRRALDPHATSFGWRLIALLRPDDEP